MNKRIIENITFFSKDGFGYRCELNRVIETKEDTEQFDKDITKFRKSYFQYLTNQNV